MFIGSYTTLYQIRRPNRRVSFSVCLDYTYTCTLILRYTHVYVAYTYTYTHTLYIRKLYDAMDRGTGEGGGAPS